MVIHAYPEEYLTATCDNLGNMFDYAVNTCDLALDDFFSMFIASGIAEQFGKGNPRYITGMSGAELAQEVIQTVQKKPLTEPVAFYLDKSPEYWCGWSMAYYQWRTGRSFKKIRQSVSMDEILFMYPTHHEADIERFVETMDMMHERRHTMTYLVQYRKNANLTIEELAEQSKVDKQLLKELESNPGKINSIDSIYVFHLAQVLGCNMEDLLEI